MRRSSSRAKSARKPLTDISNGGKSLKQPATVAAKKKISPQEPEQEGAVLDRLLLAHSDLSKLINQIDELVVQAMKVEVTNKKGIKGIESFTSVLSDMHSSLKSWIPRFQKSLPSPLMDSENQLGQSSPVHTFPTVTEEISKVNSPKQFELSGVSASPLVSWCAERTIQSGRQLFLLTPLPRAKGLSSKRPGSSRSMFARKMDDSFNTTLRRSSILNITEITNDDLLEGVEMKSTPTKMYNPFTEVENTFDHGFVSPPKLFDNDHSMLLMTPSLKRSPPKSCVLLEPITESFQQDCKDISKISLSHVGSQNCSDDTSEPSSGYITKSLAMKYPELFGLQKTHRYRIGSKEVEATPCDPISPPKSCVLLEPPKEKQSTNLAFYADCVLDKDSKSQAAATDKDVRGAYQSTKKTYNQELCSASVLCLQSTPMWKESASKQHTGKQPGENTLKRELWTKFQAASSKVYQFDDDSVFLETSGKGFLDRLEEVSIEDMSSVPKGLRDREHQPCS